MKSLLLLLLVVFTAVAMAGNVLHTTNGLVRPSFLFGKGAHAYSSSQCSITQYVLDIQVCPNGLGIHGLWPDGNGCSTCSTEKFNENDLDANTLAAMNKVWTSCKGSNSNEEFWSHEWSKHGTCSGLTQEAFFSGVINLYNQYIGDCPSQVQECRLCFTPDLKYEGPCA